MPPETHPYEAKANRVDLPGANHHSSDVQDSLPQAANILEILTTEEFAARMKMCEETINKWKQGRILRNGVHYLQQGLKATFPWPHAYIMLMKDIREQSGAEAAEETPNTRANKVSCSANIGQSRNSKTARASDLKPKVNLSYTPLKSNQQ